MFSLHLKALCLFCPPREQVGLTEKCSWAHKEPLEKWHFSDHLLFLWGSVASFFSHSRKSILEIHQNRNPNSQDSSRPQRERPHPSRQSSKVRTRLSLWRNSLPLPRLQFPTQHLWMLFLSKATPWVRWSYRLNLRVCVSMSGGFWGTPAPPGGSGPCPHRFETEGWDFIDRIYAYWIT